jgi:outer membrane receptor protein involved in Fe transport
LWVLAAGSRATGAATLVDRPLEDSRGAIADSTGDEPLKEERAVASDSNLQADTAREKTTSLEKVVVKGRKSEARRIAESGFNVSVIETRKYANTTADIAQVLNREAGVRVRETGGLGSDFNLYLNGLSGKQIRFFVDGLPVDDFGSVFRLNNIPVNLVERVDVYKGAVPIHLGSDALGGAVDIVTRKGAENYLDASESYGSFNTHRANLSAQWRDSASGFTVAPQGFLNSSDNDYLMRDLETKVDDRFVTGDFHRFHDGYLSYLGNLEMGFTRVGWADRFFVGAGYGALEQGVQSAASGSKNGDGSFSIPVAGEARQEEKDGRGTLKFSKDGFLLQGLKANFFASYGKLRKTSIDSSSNRYNWRGEVISRDIFASGEFGAGKTVFKYDQMLFVQNTGLVYDVDRHHQASLNFTSSYLERQGKNVLGSGGNDPFGEPNWLEKRVGGLAYRNTVFADKLQTTASLKYFDMEILARNARMYQFGKFQIEDLRTRRRNWGYGLASRYQAGKNWLFKASYEKTYRLPEAEEIFGDGLLTLANPNLIPETSDNLNLGSQFKWFPGEDGKLTCGVNGFLRVVDDMIFPTSGGRFMSYDNVPGVLIRGAEAEIGYSHADRFSLAANATYQDVLNDAPYQKGTSLANPVYGDRMYNTPYLFANADAGYAVLGARPMHFELKPHYGIQYIREFYLNYPSIARGGSKYTIPSQFIQNTGASLSWAAGRYNLNLECGNLADTPAYDEFALQKPGRAFSAKLRVLFN